MKTKILYIESNNEFSKEEKKKIQKAVSSVSNDVEKILGIESLVNITFYRVWQKPGGFTWAKDWIAVTLPKGKIDYEDLEALLYHELHHTVRGYVGYLEKGENYLLDSLFSEGLATALEVEKLAKGKTITHSKYSKSLVHKWLPKMKKELYKTKNYDHQKWFHGKGTPKELGYRIGKYLVDEIQRHHPELTHKDLVKKDARELLKLSAAKF